MLQAKFKITGTSPLLMHCDQLADPLNPLKKEISKYTGKRKKTDDDHEMIAKLEWQAGMYFDDHNGPIIPGRMVKAMMIQAAKKTKDGPKVKSGVQVLTTEMPVQYDGPRTLEKMWKDGRFTDKRSVVVQRARTIRCRPKFMKWSIEAAVAFDEGVVDLADIVRFLETGGMMVGIGDYRPENGGDFGRFEVEVM
jgi:hypothetical protein